MVNIDHILTTKDLVTSNTYMDEKRYRINHSHTRFRPFVMVTSYFNSNNYKHTVTLTRNILEAAFLRSLFFAKKIRAIYLRGPSILHVFPNTKVYQLINRHHHNQNHHQMLSYYFQTQ